MKHVARKWKNNSSDPVQGWCTCTYNFALPKGFLERPRDADVPGTFTLSRLERILQFYLYGG